MLKWMLSIFLLFLCEVCFATPDSSSKSKELFLGSNNAEFAILRTVREVKGSHFVTYYKKYLDVYAKELDQTKEGLNKVKLKKSILMVDFSENSVNYPKLDVTVHQKDTTLSYAELLVKYHQKLHKVEARVYDFIESEKEVKITKLISEKLGYKHGEEKHRWKIEEVLSDSDSIYLKMSLGGNNRYICVLPEEVKQLKERL